MIIKEKKRKREKEKKRKREKERACNSIKYITLQLIAPASLPVKMEEDLSQQQPPKNLNILNVIQSGQIKKTSTSNKLSLLM